MTARLNAPSLKKLQPINKNPTAVKRADACGFGQSPIRCFKMFVSPEFDFTVRLALQTACRFGKRNQTEQETNSY